MDNPPGPSRLQLARRWNGLARVNCVAQKHFARFILRVLIIRRVQMETLTKAAERQFQTRLADSLHRTHPQVCARLWGADTGRNQARAFVKAGREAGVRYGIAAERELKLFLALRLNLGAEFEQLPECRWMQPILRDPGLDGPKKIQLIMAQLAADSRSRNEAQALSI